MEQCRLSPVRASLFQPETHGFAADAQPPAIHAHVHDDELCGTRVERNRRGAGVFSLNPEAARARHILRLGLPIIGGMFTYVLLDLIVMEFVGHFGVVAVVAVGISDCMAFSRLALFAGARIAV